MGHFLKTLLSIFVILVVGVSLYGISLRGSVGNPTFIEVGQQSQVGGAFESSHERSPYAVISQIHTSNTTELSESWANVAYPDVGYLDGRYYSFFPPGLPWTLYPAYIIGLDYNVAQLATYGMMPLFSVGTMLGLYLISRHVFKLPYWASVLAALVFAFASPSWSYSITIYQHALSTFLLISGFYAAWLWSKRARFSWIAGVWVGVSYGWSIFVDYPNALLLLPNLLLVAHGSFKFLPSKEQFTMRFRVAAILVALVVAVLGGYHARFNLMNYGNATTVSNALIRYEGPEKSQALLTESDEILDSKAAEKQKVVGILHDERFPRGLVTLLISLERGLFIFAPIFLLGIVGMFYAMRDRAVSGWLVLLAAVNLFVYASFGDPWGGWAFGPRYLIPMMAVLSIFVSYFAALFIRTWWGLIVSVGLLLYSSGVSLLGALTSNAIPPRVEAEFLGMDYGIPRSLRLLEEGVTGSFAYHSYIQQYMSLQELYWLLFYYLAIAWIVLLIIIPRTSSYHWEPITD